MDKKTKSIFSSTTFWGALLMLWLSISPEIKQIADNKEFSISNLITVVDKLAATLIIIIGRYNAKEDLFTPKYLPGRDEVK